MVDWSAFGFNERDGAQSTFWLGSQGAYTVCHYDTYGCNLVAQIYGRYIFVIYFWVSDDAYAVWDKYSWFVLFLNVMLCGPKKIGNRKLAIFIYVQSPF